MKCTSAIALLALTPAAALAQFSTGSSVTFSLDWADVNGTPNGILEPGESVLLRMSVSFTNQNTTTTFSPPVGPFSSGTIRGLGSGFVDINGTGLTQGTWDFSHANGYGVAPAWDLTGQSPIVANGGSNLRQIQFGQLPVGSAGIVTTNPIVNVFTALWTPSSYAFGYREFRVGGSAAAGNMVTALDLQVGTSSVAAAYMTPVYTSVIVSIPSPSCAALLAAPLLRRRRR